MYAEINDFFGVSQSYKEQKLTKRGEALEKINSSDKSREDEKCKNGSW